MIDPTETFYDDDEDEYEETEQVESDLEECGQVPEGGCLMAGTEYCDFECPYRDINLFRDNEEDE